MFTLGIRSSKVVNFGLFFAGKIQLSSKMYLHQTLIWKRLWIKEYTACLKLIRWTERFLSEEDISLSLNSFTVHNILKTFDNLWKGKLLPLITFNQIQIMIIYIEGSKINSSRGDSSESIHLLSGSPQNKIMPIKLKYSWAC